MRSAAHERGTVAGWGVVKPPGPSRVAGVSMAGFRSGGAGPVDVRVVPHPAVTLALEFGNGPLVVDVATGRQQRGNLVAGFLHSAVRVRGENIECLQVRLSPVAARAVLGASPSELDRTLVALDDLWGRDAARIGQRLGDATSWQDRFALTEALLARRAETGPAVDPEVVFVWDRMLVSRGRVRVEDLAAEVGWSRKRLWSRFRSQIGLPPKRAARLVRFDHAAHRLAAGEGAAGVAADSGYADQSHLHRDVLAFTAMTPATVAGQPWLSVDGIAWAEHGVGETG
ncbi:AraC family transcriptional regulator [Streptomyces roseirectus]|uniref:AraC family transcriptional regulator n=1 Tax=Streptomyces roseirectus TaxID=2768066 RepID=A0A7H0IQ05_9ACTN|nr:helix-turn-helix domain-containing protein [Streptomyces roseirectus]QNP74871.1 AraC family transcriptional regulator [Streptomyces roseirectus]